MPGQEFLLGECQSAFDSQGNLLDKGTVAYLREVLVRFTKYVEAVKPLKIDPVLPAEDLMAQNPSDTTIEGVDMTDPEWVEKAAEKVGAVSGNTYVKLDRGLLTVDQLNWFLKTIPLELTYADENNQYLYYNRTQPGESMFASRYQPDVGSPLGVVHPERAYKNVQYVIGQLRSGNMPGVHVHVPIHKDHYVVHNYVAMHDEDGKYRGINEHVLDLQPVIDWYLEQTGQQLVGSPDANTGASMGGAWGTGEDQQAVSDLDSGASSQGDASSGASESATPDQTSAASQVTTSDVDTGASQS